MKRFCIAAILLVSAVSVKGQLLARQADSIRLDSQIPELSYAILSADRIFAINALGFHRSDVQDITTKAKSTDYFHLGSNTKAITGFIAAYLVEQKKISWNTRFFDLFPEKKKMQMQPIWTLPYPTAYRTGLELNPTPVGPSWLNYPNLADQSQNAVASLRLTW